MNRTIEFKAKDKYTRQWIQGDLLQHMPGEIVLVNNEGTHAIDDETMSQFSGTHCYAERKVFENDILFEEIETDLGDQRVYYVVTYIEEWGRFALLDYYQYNDYIINGIEFFNDEEIDYSMFGVEKMHYAGNYFDNKDVLIDSVGGNDITLDLN